MVKWTCFLLYRLSIPSSEEDAVAKGLTTVLTHVIESPPPIRTCLDIPDEAANLRDKEQLQVTLKGILRSTLAGTYFPTSYPLNFYLDLRFQANAKKQLTPQNKRAFTLPLSQDNSWMHTTL